MKTQKDLRNIELNPGLREGLELDVAIIGAGLSGLYSAYRLVTGATASGAPTPRLVHVFEMSNRIGGRLESVTLPGMTISGELGGMRYMTSQEIVTTLIEKVFSAWLTHVDFPMGDNAHLLAYLRKQRLHADAWTQAQARGEKLATRYHLDEADLGFSADQLFNKVIYDVLMQDPWFVEKYGQQVSHPSEYEYEFKLTSRDWDEIKPNLTYLFDGPYKGHKVNDLGFWNLLKDRVSQEGYSFLAEAGGYYSNTINWNAAEAFPYMVGDFSDASVSYRTIEGGYDLIAYALAQGYLESRDDNVIWSENRLVTFEHAREASPRRYHLVFENLRTRKQWSVYADNIILGMPRRSLELLEEQNPGNFFFHGRMEQRLKENIQSVLMEPSLKILMGFEYPWWKEDPDFGATSGHSITDLPMRQCYYFGTDANNSHSLFLASYNDMSTVSFWSVLARHSERFEPRTTQLAASEQMQTLHSVQASKLMVAEVMKQVRELHGPDITVPEPYVTWYKDWTEDPYGGGYHAWKAGYSVRDVMPFMRRPDEEEAVFICGEAYSDQQGWVEGAFCVAERMLQDHLGMRRPDWLNQEYYLGW